MAAMFQIPCRPSPELHAATHWSSEFQDFVRRCLVKDPTGRATAADLKSHSFLDTAHTPSSDNFMEMRWSPEEIGGQKVHQEMSPPPSINLTDTCIGAAECSE